MLARPVLCPIALDDAWKAKLAAQGTPGDRKRKLWLNLEDLLVLDFSGWESPAAYAAAFGRLVRGLRIFYGPGDDGASGEAAAG